VDVKINKIINILQKVNGSSIVYCKSRRRTKEISDLLNMNGIGADFYHAGLTSAIRHKKQEDWIKNTTRVIVCTNAFGMGIDKPDVRTVIHADVPDCPENYYQEAGRVGRDGKKAYAILLHDNNETGELKQLPDIRFPSIENIRLIYQAIMNFLQIPAGTGEGNYYEFDFTSFINTFKLDSQLALYAIRALEQEGLLSFNEQIFLPAKIQFTTGKDALYQFEKTYPALEELIKTLLRQYEGIFDVPVHIHERSIAFQLRRDEQEIIRDLQRLHAFAIIEYIPQKDSPQLYFLQNRVKAEDLKIHAGNYEKRKKQLAERIHAIISYLEESKQCRSQHLASYFGDDKTAPCGICDNCLQRNQQPLSTEEFEHIERQLIHALQENPVPAETLMQQFTGLKKEKAWKVLEFLQAENRVEVGKSGLITIR
jgi:ATP-dependent DNA helicase RecQ